MELMDCATPAVYKAGLGHTVKNVNIALSFFVLALFLVYEVLCTIIIMNIQHLLFKRLYVEFKHKKYTR